MSTRSIIALETPFGYQAIYCHHDGDPGHVGRILAAHYGDTQRVERLMMGGDIPDLEPEIDALRPYDDLPRHARTLEGLVKIARLADADWLYLFADDLGDGQGWVCRKMNGQAVDPFFDPLENFLALPQYQPRPVA